MSQSDDSRTQPLTAAALAWLVTSIFYFYQYAMRSAPAVMVPQLSEAFGVTPAGLAGLLGFFYYGYALFSLVAGIAMDQLGPRRVIPIGAAAAASGALLFSSGNQALGASGCFLEGAGGVFALIGAAYIATDYFPASRAATLIGVTQMFGMAGGSAGQFLAAPVIAAGVPWSSLWLTFAIAGAALAVVLFVLVPRAPAADASIAAPRTANWMTTAYVAIGAVFRNPQSILCGLIAGFMFMPTTIFSMVWGVSFLQEAHDLPFGEAVLLSASVPFGWMIGCPLMGLLSDRIGRRKPVIIASAAVLCGTLSLILYGAPGRFPAYSLGLITGISSGAAMLPYTIIKEANRPEHSGTATGVINFINFSMSALLGPLFGSILTSVSNGGERELAHYQTTFETLIYGIGLAIILALFLKETGPAVRRDEESVKPKSAARAPLGKRPAVRM